MDPKGFMEDERLVNVYKYSKKERRAQSAKTEDKRGEWSGVPIFAIKTDITFDHIKLWLDLRKLRASATS